MWIKNYNTSDVVCKCNQVQEIYGYSINYKWVMIFFVGDIEKEISKIDGVLNLIELRVLIYLCKKLFTI